MFSKAYYIVLTPTIEVLISCLVAMSLSNGAQIIISLNFTDLEGALKANFKYVSFYSCCPLSFINDATKAMCHRHSDNLLPREVSLLLRYGFRFVFTYMYLTLWLFPTATVCFQFTNMLSVSHISDFLPGLLYSA